MTRPDSASSVALRRALDLIGLAFAKLDIPGGDRVVARALGVNASTVSRWRTGEARPRPGHREAIGILLACAKRREAGPSHVAERALRGFAACDGLAEHGAHGFVRALGYGWVFSERGAL